MPPRSHIAAPTRYAARRAALASLKQPAVWLVFALVALWAPLTAHAQVPTRNYPTDCTSHGGDLDCVRGGADFVVQTYPNTGARFPNGDTACRAAANEIEYRNPRYFPAHPQFGPGCMYDFFVNGQLSSANLFKQNWVVTQQFCSVPDNFDSWYDRGDQSQAIEGALWCVYRDARQDLTCEVGRPVLPGIRAKVYRELLYAGSGAHALSFSIHYRSWRYERSDSGLGEVGSRGAGWMHSEFAQLADTSGQTVRPSRLAIRPDGNTESFFWDGAKWTNFARSRNTLTELKDSTGNRTGWQLRSAEDDSLETYTAAGVRAARRERNGWTTTYTYSTASTPAAVAPRAGLLVAIRNHFGRELRLTYDGAGRIREVLPPGAVSNQAIGSASSPITLRYNEAVSLGSQVVATAPQLTSIQWSDDLVHRYHYGNATFPSHATGMTDGGGTRRSTVTYGADGRVLVSEGAGGADRYEFMHNPNFNETVVTATGTPGTPPTTTTYRFATIRGAAQPLGVSAPCALCGGTTQAAQYDTSGRALRHVAHDGSVTFYTYDARGRETQRATYPPSFNASATRPPLTSATSVITTRWHTSWNLRTQVASPQEIAAFTYDSASNLTGTSLAPTTDLTGASAFAAVRNTASAATSTGWAYNSQRLPITIIDQLTPAGSTTAVEQWRSSITYSSAGELQGLSVTAGAVTDTATIQTDLHGRLTRVAPNNGATVTWAWTPRGMLASASTPQAQATFTTDARGWLSEVRLNNGTWLRVTYSPMGEPTEVVTQSGQVLLAGGGAAPWWRGSDPLSTALTMMATAGMRGGDRLGAMLVPTAQAQAGAAGFSQRLAGALSRLPAGVGSPVQDPDAPPGGSCCSAAPRAPTAEHLQRSLMNNLAFGFMMTVADAFAQQTAEQIIILNSTYRLEKNLRCEGIYRPTREQGCYQLHHIVPRGLYSMVPEVRAAQLKLTSVQIGLEDAANGAYVPCALHSTLHNRAYFVLINGLLQTKSGQTEVRNELKRIGSILSVGRLP